MVNGFTLIKSLKVKNPFNNNTISSISVVGRNEIKNAIDSASEAFSSVV